jgi:ureidoacrylate peracid hydrolase
MITLHPDETALLLIDMQNGMIHPEGTLGLSGVDTAELQALVPAVARLVGACRAAGIPDIWSRQIHFAHDRARDAHRITPHTRKRARIACEAGTWDAEIVDELQPLLNDDSVVIEKHKWGCFYGTRLEPLLRILGTRLLIVCGTTTNACVDTTLREAAMRDFDVVVPADAVGGIDEAWRGPALAVWERYIGEVVTVDEIEQQLASLEAAA